MTFFFFLPSILLSGFMFPFRGMPLWAQVIGEVLPLTHFLRVVRGIMLKGSDIVLVLPNLWPVALFLLVIGSAGPPALPPHAGLTGWCSSATLARKSAAGGDTPGVASRRIRVTPG